MEDEMHRACSIHGEAEECIQNLSREIQKEETTWLRWTDSIHMNVIYNVEVWTDFNWLVLCSVVFCFKHDNEPLGFIRGKEFLDQLSYCLLLKNGCFAWKVFFSL
jgi:hypothetical protein